MSETMPPKTAPMRPRVSQASRGAQERAARQPEGPSAESLHPVANRRPRVPGHSALTGGSAERAPAVPAPAPVWRARRTRQVLAATALLALAACAQDGIDADLRGFTALGFDTSTAARGAVQSRPAPDSRGVISYPTYQVAVAQSGDTVSSLAGRVGLDATELARYNALQPATQLNRGEVIALPRRVSEPATTTRPAGAASSSPTGTVAGAPSEQVDITSLASSAIERAAPAGAAPGAAAATTTAPAATPAARSTGAEPVRHKVTRGETAYSIARYYNVPVKSLAEWNGLSGDLSVREGQFLLIPLASASATSTASVSQPGEGSPTPTPPSATRPLPKETPPKASDPVDTSAAPNLGASRSAASAASTLAMPASGSVVRAYVKGKNDGIDIGAAPGSAVKAAAAGTVAAITKDTDQVPILVLRHDDGLLTVYANIEGISVAKGDSVKRGQTIAKARAGDGTVHFEVRKGYDSVDPMPYLQ